MGCGPGFLLDEAKKLGWDVKGIEPFEWDRRYAREQLGLDVTPGSLESSDLKPNTFDVILLLDVIEHLENPASALERAERLLKPGGILYVSTPDVAGLPCRVLGKKWWGYQKRSLNYFSSQTLLSALQRAGFRALHSLKPPRIFSLKYCAHRLSVYSPWLKAALSRIWRSSAGGMLICLPLGDQVDWIARKPTTFLNIKDAEPPPLRVGPGTQPKVIVVLPAYNAAKTLKITMGDIPEGTADEIILVDDHSQDDTFELAEQMGLKAFRHPQNLGYGGNQKTCYRNALAQGADIIVMLHPDYQYDPKIIPSLIEPIREGRVDAVFGSRMMKGGALEGGMPIWKHNANILLTAFENVVLRTYLTEYHSGFRAYSARLLRAVPFEKNSDNFVFDTEIIVQALALGFRIEEIPIRTRYFEGASMIGLARSVEYGFSILGVLFRYKLHEWGLWRSLQFGPTGR